MTIETVLSVLKEYLVKLNNEQKIEALNKIKISLHQISPFKNEPIDCVLWIKRQQIIANDYNPNVMSPTEKRLLETSLVKDGYTQPVVVLPIQQSKNKPSQWQVVDGYHRYLLSKKNSLNKRINGYLPITVLDVESHTMADQMAATIRHNRARGQHQVAAMSDIVRDLSRLGWNDQKIGDELGMSQDEVLRLKQISGLAELFSEHDFSEAWTIK
ncbi:TPA: ParB-like nuclease domain-containing protein [Proteus mirabilis]|uniref:IbrB-like domain-containing protein n=5 Tax=Proteus mirabilis TaxID=584 RepID=UPI0018C4E015|nr:ParB/RepB/Spo0J family partition protein [Proteus mirabilis]MDU6163163.1 ParB/RepB/Spo0J family partition protein [Staphylococcus epidermidis]ELA7718172.1 ParB-like nuclease domain-containing protein [Proteus mirabilis]MBG2898385.1 ParB-like nuclease domain-containing protein [Proteus mirabilis]MBG5954890.1 ParB-like nuclease domain-containing protein [Proteus mirabilis]MBI6315997.1 ParB-like nuclease domain-containing protein [Proteus mirabilis]